MILLRIEPGTKRPRGEAMKGWTKPEFVAPPIPDGWNVGLRLDGLTVVDCDSPEAVEWWEANGEPTPYMLVGRPGRRSYWYRGECMAPGAYNWVLPNGQRGGEVRTGRRAQCVVAPSIHPDTGQPYQWVGPDLVADLGREELAYTGVPAGWPQVRRYEAPIPGYPFTLPPRDPKDRQAPDGWVLVHTAPDVVEWLPNEWCPAKPYDGTDTGHHSPGLALAVLEGGLLMPYCRGGCERPEVIEALVAEGRYDRDELWPPAREPEPWADEEAQWVAISDEAVVAAPTRTLDEPLGIEWVSVVGGPPAGGDPAAGRDGPADDGAPDDGRTADTEFPVEALPQELRRLVVEGSRAICCPPDYIGAAGLAILGAAIGGNVSLRVVPGWEERAALWVAVVGEPGARKSPALKPLMAPVFKEQARLFDVAKSLRQQEKQAAKDEKRQPNYVPTQKVMDDDVTIEVLTQRTLVDNPAGVLIHSDELSGWARAMGQYRGGLGRDRQHWLSVWSGQSFTVDRKNLEAPIFVKEPFVAIVGGIQPDVLGDIGAGRDDGLMERLLIAQGAPKQVRLTGEYISRAALDDYGALWRRLRDQSMYPATVQLTDEAWGVFREWHDRTMEDMEQVAPALRGVWAKMPAQCARIALILSRCSTRQRNVDAETVERAILVADYFKGQVRTALVSQSPDTPYERQHAERLDQLEAWIKANPRATKRDILRSGPGRWSRKSESLEPVLRDLMAAHRAEQPGQ